MFAMHVGLDGLRAVLDELSTLSGSRKDAVDALVSDGDSQYDKVRAVNIQAPC